MKNKANNPSGIKALSSFLKPYKVPLIISVLLAIIGTACRLISPLMIKRISEIILDGVPSSANMPFTIDFGQIAIFGSIAIVLFIGAFALDYAEAYIAATFTSSLSKDLRKGMSAKINKLPLSYFDSRNIGDVLSVMTNDIDTVGTTLNQIFSSVINAVIMLLGILGIVFALEWKFGIILLIALPLEILLLLFIGKHSQGHFLKQQQLLSTLSAKAEENYTAFNINKIYRNNDRAIASFEVTNNDYAKENAKAQSYSGLTMPLMVFVGNVAFSVICLLGATIIGYELKQTGVNDVTYIAVIVACITYANQMNQPLMQIAQIIATFQQTLASSVRVYDFFQQVEQEDETSKTDTIEHVEGNIEFDHVQFSYDSSRVIIHDFTEKASKGQKIAIVGPTGAGKTTMVNLLMRFYDIQKGEIRIEGKCTKDLNRSYVRSLFGMVLQDTWLFEGTIMDNLKFSRRDATDEEVKQACKATHCEEFILQQEHGYDTVITGDGGLSSGQKQLITIARAMVQNAPMLILDEATSSVDTRTELLIQEAMDALMKGRTSFVIAHRLSTIKNSDIILVMKDGDVIESGNHEVLMAKKGFYADLYNAQFANNAK